MVLNKKIIGIFGGSGSGKTTATKILNEKIKNSTVLFLDPFMHQHWEEHKKEILDALNVKEDKNIWWRNYITKSAETIKQSIDFINLEIEQDIKNFISENQKHDIIIIDWAFIPYISLFNDCDFTICIDADPETKINRLSSRLEDNNRLQKWPKEALLGRINNTTLNKFGYNAKYNIENDGTIEDLRCKLYKIIKDEDFY